MGLGIRNTRKFSGVDFTYQMTFTGVNAKGRATQLAKSYRRDGDKARVAKSPGGWSVYYRGKRAWR